MLNCVQVFVTQWTVACQDLLSRQEFWSGLPFPSPEDLPDPGMGLVSPASSALQMDPLPGKPYDDNSEVNDLKK